MYYLQEFTGMPTLETGIVLLKDPKMTDWLWEEKESQEQKDRYMSFHTGKFRYVSDEEQDRKYIQKSLEDNENDLGRYQLMTSVSMPVFDRRENATKIANLLGVAGTDVPIQDIKKLLMPHRFQGILKPAYNSVDMSEVELMDDDREARDVNPKMILFREAVVNQSHGSTMLNVKYHYDNMRRVNTVKRTYHYIGIENTPFTLVVTIPESYGRSKVVAQLETHLMRSQGYSVFHHEFGVKGLKQLPEFLQCQLERRTYCYYHYDTEHHFDTPEQELYHFLERTQQPKWHWKSKRTVTPPEHVTQCYNHHSDRDLFLSLVFDAKATEWFSKNFSSSSKEEKGQQFRQRFGITITFVATHSGLTRWQDMPGMEDNKKEPHFSMVHNRAIDEVWYQRAVEQHEFEPDCFVYSVPFDADTSHITELKMCCTQLNNHKLVAKQPVSHNHGTASGAHAPFQLFTFLLDHSRQSYPGVYTCHDPYCVKTCESDALGCYVLDNNAYIVVSKEIKDTGRFFGDIDGYVMESLVKEKIYKKIHMFDYQAVCFRGEPTKSQGSILMTILSQADSVNTNEDDEEGEESEGTAKPTDPPYEKMQINRTRPDACDAEMDLYKLVKYSQKDQSPYQNKQMACMRPYVVQAIPYSNMILLVVDLTCPRTAVPMSIFPIEVEYRNFSLACYKAHFFDLHRTRPLSCINNHTKPEHHLFFGMVEFLQKKRKSLVAQLSRPSYLSSALAPAAPPTLGTAWKPPSPPKFMFSEPSVMTPPQYTAPVLSIGPQHFHRHSLSFRNYPLPPIATRVAGTVPLPPTTTHVAGTVPLSPTATHVAGTVPLPPTATHIAGTLSTPPTATSCCRDYILSPSNLIVPSDGDLTGWDTPAAPTRPTNRRPYRRQRQPNNTPPVDPSSTIPTATTRPLNANTPLQHLQESLPPTSLSMESEIEHLCGGSSIVQLSLLLLFPSWALAYFVFSER
uniref:Voltage-dependent calcium channel alpha-2/delta subunit conserved region domain-containing protein n=1 Tax=Timema monikensis TaxID=170555 RepID=A0A7R9HQB6_9NEOP|nr:unnamed protein product [Timema monikensis]